MLPRQFVQGRFAVEWGVVGNNDTGLCQLFEQVKLQPVLNHTCVARTSKQHRCQPPLTSVRHNEIGAILFVIASALAINLAAARCPGVGIERLFLKSTLIKVDEVLSAVLRQELTQCLEVFNAFRIHSFLITGRFF